MMFQENGLRARFKKMIKEKNTYFKAAVLEKTNSNLKVKDLNFSKLSRGQVLVKVLYSGICRSQLMEIQGKRGEDKWLPHCLGHEASGEVVSTGAGVKKVKPKDKVILTWIKSKGINATSAKYYCKDELINSGQITTFSNYTVISENRLILKPKELSMEEAVLFGCAIPTGFGMVMNEIMPKKNMSVLLIGLGGVGLSSLIALKCLGIKNIVVVDLSSYKLQIANSFGVSKTLNVADKNFLNKINAINPNGFDICIESAGRTDTIELGFSLINETCGRLYFASHPSAKEKISLSPHELIKGKRIYGSWGGKTDPDIDIKKMAELIKKSKINISSLIKKNYKLSEINKAISDLESGKIFRPIIKMSH